MNNTARQAAPRMDDVGAPADERETAANHEAELTPVASIADFPSRKSEPIGDAPRASTGDGERSRYWKWAAVLVVAALVVAWWLMREPAGAPEAVASSAPAAPLELAAVDLAVVEPRVLTRVLPLSGTISPFVQATVKSKVSGEVEEVLVREGQDVKAGDILARIDSRNLQAQYDRELAAVEKARADLELARLNRDKNRALLEQKFISQNTYEQTESAYAASVASLKLAEAQARLAKLNLEDAVVRAPFDGTIAKRLVHPGDKASPDSAIVTLVDLRHMQLEAAVPAADIPAVRIGQIARFRVNGFGTRDFEGQVQRINPVTADGSRAIMIYVAVPNEDRALKGGMFAQGQLTLDATEPVLAIPQRAVREEAGANYVLTLQNGKVARTPVRLGAAVSGAGYVEVREGLAAGDRVIVADVSDDKVGAEAVVRGEPAQG